MIEIYNYALIKAKEIGIEEATTFAKEDQPWMKAMVIQKRILQV